MLVFAQHQQRKMNGVSLWADDVVREAEEFNFLFETNANWVSIQPYGVVSTDSTGVEYFRDDIWETSSYSGLVKYIEILHGKGYKVFLKPHLILKYNKAGAWVGDMKLSSEKKWKIFETTYERYVLSLARLADSMKVELFGVGTEIGGYVLKRKEHCGQLIDSVRSIYKGAITYCANFDAYKKFPFWEKMDVMGIDAYFTISSARTPDLDKCRENWKSIAKKIKEFSELKGKKVLFTEFGYRSADFCALTPFGGNSPNVNLVGQANAYRALFDTFWDKDWFVGGFSWIWRFDNSEPENYDNTNFSPQNKPAGSILSKTYLLYK